MIKKIPLLSLCAALAACGPNSAASRSGAQPVDEGANDAQPVGLTQAERAKYDVEGALLGMPYAEVRKIWHSAHPGFRIDERSEWEQGLGTYVTSVRFLTASGDNMLEARFTSPAAGNRAIFLSHTLQDMGAGTPIDRKSATALVMAKFGNTALVDGPNTYGGEVVGKDGRLKDGCSDFKFPNKSNPSDPGKNYPQCGLAALASITGDNESTADVVELQITDFVLLANLEKEEASGLQRNRENVGRRKLPKSVKPSSL